MHRVSLAKQLALTARDIAIFQALGRYRYLRSTYLHAFAGGASETRFKERLGDLFHEGFLDRPQAQWQFAAARYEPAVYELGARASRVLAESGEEAPMALTFLSPRPSRQFRHAVLISSFLASVELTARATSGLRFIGWPEILERAPESTRAQTLPFRIALADGGLIPDALFGLAYLSGSNTAYRFCALEIDRGTMPVLRTSATQTSYAAKLAAYEEILGRSLHQSQWGVSRLLVLTLTTTQDRLASMLAHVPSNSTGAGFLFRAMSELPHRLLRPETTLLAAPWVRANLAPVSFAQP